MQSTTDDRAVQSGTPAAAATETVAGIEEHAKGWLKATRSRANSIARLAVAEAKLAATSIALMAFLGMLAAGFAFGAWALAVVVALQFLDSQDIPLWIATLTLALAHAVAARILWRSALNLSSKLEFQLTREQFSHPDSGQ